MPALAASITPSSEDLSQGWATAVGIASPPLHSSIRSSYLLRLRKDISGNSARAQTIFSLGAMTSAVPVRTVSPSWFSHRQSKTIVPVSGRFSLALTVTRTLSPRAIGRWNDRFWLL